MEKTKKIPFVIWINKYKMLGSKRKHAALRARLF